TVQEYDPATGEGNGFVFVNYDPWEFFAAIIRAMAFYRFKETWRTIQRHGMAADHSWRASAIRYIEIYRKAMEFHERGN
ncbi:MAG TPA: hypothetical protein VKX46_20465, partial [Ktedonobacteraceae bacterium]|nr:hypothetical protein [Ktedonobacteraceae bacterium]